MAVLVNECGVRPFSNMLFKENEVLIATKESVLSARNAFVCRVCKINKGELLSEVGFEFEDGVVSSIITTDSLMRLGVKEGTIVGI